MCRTESGLSGPKLQSSPDPSKSDSSEVVLYCPECAARLRLVGCQLQEQAPPKPVDESAPLDSASREDKGQRSTLPDWLPSSGALADPLPIEPATTSSEPKVALPTAPVVSIGSAFEVTVALPDAEDEDAPTRVMNSVDLLEREQPVPAEPESATRPDADVITKPVCEREEPSIVVRDNPADSVALPVDERVFDDKTGPVSRRARSDAPLTRDLAFEPEALPDFRNRSRLRPVGIALGVALVGGIAFLGHRALSSDSVDGPPPPIAAAVSPALTALVPAQVTPNAVSPIVPAVASIEAPANTTQSAKSKKAERVPMATGVVASAPPARESHSEAAATESVLFDADAAASALDRAAGRASTCRKASDPSGVAVVTVTFAPSGRVTTATISGPPFVGTATGSCIAAAMRGAKIPAFAGQLKTVKKTVTIQ